MPLSSLPVISKTSFLTGTQCSKLLWMKLHERDAFPPVSEQQQAIFDQGHEIGPMAKGLYPGGIEVAEGIYRHNEALKATAAVLSQRKASLPRMVFLSITVYT